MFVFTLPSGQEAEIREMTGVEEDLLTDERLMRNGNPINQVLENCLIRLGDNREIDANQVLDLLAGDRLFLLVKLREISLGRTVVLALKCPDRRCGEINHTEIDLGLCTVTPYPAERQFSHTLPRSGQTVVFGFMNGRHEKRLAALKTPDITAMMLMRILSVDGKPPNKKTVRQWSLQDRVALRQAMAEVDGGIDTTVKLDCAACGAAIQTRLEQEQAFLFPSTLTATL